MSAFMILFAAAASAQCPAPTEASVRAAFDQWLAAYRSRDLEGTMAIFDENVRFHF